MYTADAIDLRILALLQEDGKMTNKEVAGRLGLTVTPVYERIRRLEREGFIRQYAALLSKEKLGLEVLAFCNVSLREHSRPLIKQFEQEVLLLKEVLACWHIGGGFDYLLKVVVEDMESYQTFIVDKLAALDNIGQVQSSFVLTEVKNSTAYPL